MIGGTPALELLLPQQTGLQGPEALVGLWLVMDLTRVLGADLLVVVDDLIHLARRAASLHTQGGGGTGGWPGGHQGQGWADTEQDCDDPVQSHGVITIASHYQHCTHTVVLLRHTGAQQSTLTLPAH